MTVGNAFLESRLLAGRHALVTGAAGFLGAHLVRALEVAGCRVTALVRPSSNIWRFGELGARPRVVRADLLDLGDSSFDASVDRPDLIFHLAAAGVDQFKPEARELVSTNVAGTLAALRFAERVGAQRFIYAGSSCEYGECSRADEDQKLAPVDEFGASKAAGWVLAHAFGRRSGLAVTTLRPFSAYGPLESPQRLVPYVVGRAVAGEPMELTGGRQTRDFVYIDDVVSAFVLAAISENVVDETLNVCTGHETSIRDLVFSTLELTGHQSTPLFGARAYRATELWTLSGNPTRARQYLGWTATTPLIDGLAKTVRWLRERRELGVPTPP
jgi:nucleoside-diphosphate-sugar epimerase